MLLWDWKVSLLGKKPLIFRSYGIAGKNQTDTVLSLLRVVFLRTRYTKINKLPFSSDLFTFTSMSSYIQHAERLVNQDRRNIFIR